jgi:hypothetical protein
MVYQTPIAQLVGAWLGPELVRSYAASAVARFGPRAGLDLGIVGEAGVGVDPGQRYPEPEAVWRDISVARDAGVSLDRMRLYGLQGVMTSGGVDKWLSRRDVASGRVSSSEQRLVTGLRNGIRALEVALRVAAPECEAEARHVSRAARAWRR